MERKTEQGHEGLGRGTTACPGASLCRELARGWSRSPSTLIVSCAQLSETTGQYRHTLHNSIDYIT